MTFILVRLRRPFCKCQSRLCQEYARERVEMQAGRGLNKLVVDRDLDISLGLCLDISLVLSLGLSLGLSLVLVFGLGFGLGLSLGQTNLFDGMSVSAEIEISAKIHLSLG